MGERQVGEMRVVGLTHLTAVSGSHFAAIALALGLLVRALGWRRPVRVLLLAAVMACFVALVFPGASVVRAAWMGGVIVVALAWGRPSQALPALASAVIGLLLVDPYLSLSYGFALSVLATAAIALWSPILAEHLCRFFTPTLARVVAVPVAAQVACAPIIVLLNPGLGPYAVPANLIAVPCAAITTIVGLVGVLASTASPGLGHVFAAAASLPAWPIAWAARGFAGAPYAWLPWPSGPVGALLSGHKRAPRGGVGADSGRRRGALRGRGLAAPPACPRLWRVDPAGSVENRRVRCRAGGRGARPHGSA
jgi:competence protein ComEC